jgi:hypothetical protein
VISAEVFGVRHFASTWGYFTLGPANLGLLLGYVAGKKYEREAKRQDAGLVCSGGK